MFCASQFVIRGSEPTAAQALMRNGGSVLKAPRAAEGALPRERECKAVFV